MWPDADVNMYAAEAKSHYGDVVCGSIQSVNSNLEQFKPEFTLGLTATPERMGGKDVTDYFNNKIAAEIRLGEAINRKILSPFNYFAVADTETLKNIKWRSGGYDVSELEKVYTKDNQRAELIVKSINKYTRQKNEDLQTLM